MAFSTGLVTFEYRPQVAVVTVNNFDLRFQEVTAGPTLLAVIQVGTWTVEELCHQTKVAMEAVGASIYNVSYSRATRLFTIESDLSGGDGTFTRVDGVQNAWTGLFGNPSGGGTSPYVSTVKTPSLVTFTTTASIRKPSIKMKPNRAVLETESGARWTTYHGTDETYSFSLEFESVATAQAAYAMLRDAAEHVELVKFSTTGQSTYCLVEPNMTIIEQTSKKLYRIYLINLTLRMQVGSIQQATGTVTLADMVDRTA